MNRIEETTRQICELGDLTHEYIINLANMVDRRDEEIKRLFSKLEIAEKVLERLSSGKFHAPIEYSQIEAYQKYSESALERIRE